MKLEQLFELEKLTYKQWCKIPGANCATLLDIINDQDDDFIYSASGSNAYGLSILEKIIRPISIKLQNRLMKRKNGVFVISSIRNFSKDGLTQVLTDEDIINNFPGTYQSFVKKQFANNIVLMNKWLRYAENIRGM